MTFTQEDKNSYLDRLALSTQQGMWMTEMALMQHEEKLAKKKALLTVLEQQLANKAFESARDGKNQIKHVQDEIADIESDIQESKLLLETGKNDLELIEKYRAKPV
jgi:hypothetical protein